MCSQWRRIYVTSKLTKNLHPTPGKLSKQQKTRNLVCVFEK
ncbi:hypothetical protein APHCRT_1010 [Anaplasma phagocytophilum str. CRT53-1]|uniref:Uncharacterized protein n=1 Tax=Anaplasma phagocytophilum str. CRT53-1 TaxID=1359157 RepID=A0A0F3PW16_ANAPH|nr:hypothetical protein APHCRT_1017 [Anaplasma phagocytophilum str. CRT53-1]KJV85644.1 hypothetical protein APHCRT_1010 [Anaplasma phagocytophilum str. CRT53-1]